MASEGRSCCKDRNIHRTDRNGGHLQRWFKENPEIVYGRSLETAKALVCDEEADQEILLEFYWVEKMKLDFAIELDRCRRDLNMTADEFAKELGVSRAYMSKLFRGDVNLTIKSMVKLARAAGARISLSTHD
jgi:DNA-binding XRE family transcriptional regulator